MFHYSAASDMQRCSSEAPGCKCVLDNSVHDTTLQRLCANVTHRSIQPHWAVNTKDSSSESGSTGNLTISLKAERHYWLSNYYN